MASLNKVVLIGHLVADPELKTTTNGVNVTTFQIGVSRRFSKGAEQSSDFFTIVAWRATAEFICNYFKKGNAICICGSLQSRSWTAQDGVTKRYTVEVVADEASFVERKQESTRVDSGLETIENEAPSFEDVTSDANLPF